MEYRGKITSSEKLLKIIVIHSNDKLVINYENNYPVNSVNSANESAELKSLGDYVCYSF